MKGRDHPRGGGKERSVFVVRAPSFLSSKRGGERQLRRSEGEGEQLRILAPSSRRGLVTARQGGEKAMGVREIPTSSKSFYIGVAAPRDKGFSRAKKEPVIVKTEIR